MRIKLVEPGWETYSDLLGFTRFENGVSVEDVSPSEAARLASIVAIEDMDGKSPSPAQMILDSWSGPMAVATTGTADTVPAGPVAPSKVWDKVELEAVADKSGIKGLREIAEPLGLKGNGIAELINKIVTATKSTADAATADAATADAATADAAAADAATVAADAAAA